jgi:O-methyltransferase
MKSSEPKGPPSVSASTDGFKQRTLLRRFYLLKRVASVLLPEYRFKWPQMAWWEDREFNAYLGRFRELDGNNSDRRYAVSQLLRLTQGVEGDTAEVGVFEGAMSWLILRAGEGRRQHHVFDSFEGLSKPRKVDGSHWTAGALACAEDAVHCNLSPFKGCFKTYKGWVPDRFHEVDSRRFSFVHIDVDLYEPTRASLEFFFPRTNPGGIIVCDDYNFTSCPGATRAFDEFLASRPEKMIGLSGGGGFLIRGTATA